MLADILMLEKQYRKASNVFLALCKVYNKWKFKFTPQEKILSHKH